MLPDIDNQDLARGKSEERTLALEILVLSSLTAVGAFDVHDKNVLGHLKGAIDCFLVFRHPYSLGGLLTLDLRHNTEACAKEVVKESRLSSRLGTEDGNEVVVEASIGNVGDAQVGVEVWTEC